ncbi:MAG: aspartate aminotransferase family protein [Candidatus Tectomicrobia bacterium]|uniref:Aspartate aminotransferase family protein n=1 Tax=Tectimicrobiota bacterium TaxID=2528274 RepID=A0A932CNQ2_UNCTE|nr:aspartate aminotransferase family protein [Candidatus Tectomicrobia bacterium]
MVDPCEERLIALRQRMRTPLEELRRRVRQSPFGPRGQEVLQKTLDHESLGLVGFSQYEAPPVIASAQGASVVDIDGKEYIDLLAGFGVSNLGHCHPKVVAALTGQAGQLIHYFDYPSEQRAHLAERLCRLSPGDFPKRVAFTVTGSDAVEMAIRAARWYTGGQFIITAYGDYHGTQIGTMALTGKARMWAYYYPVPPSDTGVIRIPFAYCYRCPFEKTHPACDLYCARHLEWLLESKEACFRNPGNDASHIAAMVIEPMQSSAGYIIPPDGFLQRLKALCDRYSILFIADEIQAGMGRTGKMWAVEHYGVVPDLITIAKGIGGGLPLSATIGRAELFEAWAPGAHVSTFAGNHLACQVANAVLDVFQEERIVEQARINGDYFLEGLRELESACRLVGDVNGKGLYLGIELVNDRRTREPAERAAAFIHRECLREGVLLQRSGYYANRLTLIPPLVIRREQIDSVLDIFRRLFARAEREFYTGA